MMPGLLQRNLPVRLFWCGAWDEVPAPGAKWCSPENGSARLATVGVHDFREYDIGPFRPWAGTGRCVESDFHPSLGPPFASLISRSGSRAFAGAVSPLQKTDLVNS